MVEDFQTVVASSDVVGVDLEEAELVEGVLAVVSLYNVTWCGMSSILIQVVILVAEEKRGLRMGVSLMVDLVISSVALLALMAGIGKTMKVKTMKISRLDSEEEDVEEGLVTAAEKKVGVLVVVVEVEEGLVDVTMG